MNQSECLVLMPFGRKTDESGAIVDFDTVYQQLILPAIRAAKLEPIRADEQFGGVIHKLTFERLIVCEYAVADLTFANANVSYELGVRHAVRPSSTALIFASGTPVPFDIVLDRGLAYSVSSTGTPADVEGSIRRLAERLIAARDASVDSPLFQLVEGYPDPNRMKTGAFRDHIRYSQQWKEHLAKARIEGIDSVCRMERELGDLRKVETGILADLFLSYRAVKGYQEMVSLTQRMPRPNTGDFRRLSSSGVLLSSSSARPFTLGGGMASRSAQRPDRVSPGRRVLRPR
jgi:MAP3K TRAFs-binding domain